MTKQHAALHLEGNRNLERWDSSILPSVAHINFIFFTGEAVKE